MNKLTEDEIMKFNTLTKAYNKLLECRNTTDVLSNQVEKDFRTPEDIENGNYFSNPIKPSYELDKIIENMKDEITQFILQHMESKFKNLKIDRRDVREFVDGGVAIERMESPFTARAVIRYIEEKYADEETITLQQLKEFASHTLPRLDVHSTDKASKPEHITVINKTGIELKDSHSYGKENSTAAVIKLIQIKLNHVIPSLAEHHDIEYGDTYSDDNIKSLRRYKNGKLKVIFHTVEDMELIRRLLVGCGDE